MSEPYERTNEQESGYRIGTGEERNGRESKEQNVGYKRKMGLEIVAIRQGRTESKKIKGAREAFGEKNR